jgi:Kef-type K+ transport system membrane component KefB
VVARQTAGWPKVIGYVLAGTFFGPSMLGWISIEALAQIRPMADAALGLLMLEIGRRLDLRWLGDNRDLLQSTLGEITLSFTAILLFAWGWLG